MPCVSLAGRKDLSRTKVHGKGDNVGAVGKTYIGRRRPVDREEAVSGREGQGCGKMLCLGLGSWLVIITEKAVVYRLCHGEQACSGHSVSLGIINVSHLAAEKKRVDKWRRVSVAKPERGVRPSTNGRRMCICMGGPANPPFDGIWRQKEPLIPSKSVTVEVSMGCKAVHGFQTSDLQVHSLFIVGRLSASYTVSFDNSPTACA
jgi:hypothetical protein